MPIPFIHLFTQKYQKIFMDHLLCTRQYGKDWLTVKTQSLISRNLYPSEEDMYLIQILLKGQIK